MERCTILGRLSRGAAAAMIVNAPLTIPAAPNPATALPIINMADDFARAQKRDPSSKSATAMRNMA